MSDFKMCENGHYFQNSYTECPYCPNTGTSNQASTIAFSDGSTGNTKTSVFNSPNPVSEGRDLSKTTVMPAQQPGTAASSTKSTRRLVGWLVTYDADPNGKDFRLYEGRNTIGYTKDCDVIIDSDNGISSKHATIRYLLGEFEFKDEFSTNGTFHNGQNKKEGILKDGDQLKVGNTVLLFRQSIKN